MPRQSTKQSTPLGLSVASDPDEAEQQAPLGETKNQRFRRLANQRGKQLIKNMRSVGRLGNPSYGKTFEEVETLIDKLAREFTFMTEQLRHGAAGNDEDDLL